ncbi:MAG: hypothetical protein ACREAE_09090, partial [Nitrosopumilaceae archaeon]
ELRVTINCELLACPNMSLIYKTCVHVPTDIEGETSCIRCGMVLGRVEVPSDTDWSSHEVALIGANKITITALKVAKNLNLPNYAIQTSIQVSTKLLKEGITKKQAVLFGVVYACRVHKIPRLLADIFYELEKTTGKPVRSSERSLLRVLNKIAKKVNLTSIGISSPDKHYYLQAYLAKIQDLVVKETDSDYFEMVRARSMRIIDSIKKDPSTSARQAILSSISRTFQPKIKEILC